MPKEHINPTSLFPSLQHGFSQIVTARGGKTVYISGQTAWDANKQIVGGADLGEQARQALRNVRTAVEAAGGTMADGVRRRFYAVIYGPEDAGGGGAGVRDFFREKDPPASTWLGVTSLAVRDFMIEIEAIAVVE